MKVFLCLAALFLGSVLNGVCAVPQAFEIGMDNTTDLPKGKEADGIMGDLVLRNSRVTALVSGNLPLRRANMSTFYGADGITPGCLYDLTLRERENDQITIFSPCEQRGAVSYVRIVEGKTNAAVVETVISAASNGGLYKRHEYRLEDDFQGILITTTLRNDSKKERTQKVADRWTTFNTNGPFGKFRWADAVDPSDRAGYAYVPYVPEGETKPVEEIKLAAGQELVISRFLAVGRSAAEAVGIAAQRAGNAGKLNIRVRDEAGRPAANATLRLQANDQSVSGYPDQDGRLAFPFPAGEYRLVIEDLGREVTRQEIKLAANETLDLDLSLPVRPVIAFQITDSEGRDLPCKAQFIGINGTPMPNLGPANRAHGCKEQYHSETGEFSVAVPPGNYRVVVTRGIEYSHMVREVRLANGEQTKITGKLERLVDTRGWISADYHNHSTPSGDNTCGTDDRLINLAAEHIEFAPTTEHNRLYDWRPHIEKLGLTRFLQTVSGMELTGSGPHQNSFPFQPRPHTQDNGAPVWNRDPRITAITLRNHQTPDPDRWVQINHPDLVENFIDRNADGLADGGYIGLGRLIDAVEVQNFSDSMILSKSPVHLIGPKVYPNREFVWLQLLNQGHRIVAMAVADAHSVHGNGVGGWRMYMPSKSDEPAEIDWRENSRHARAGRSILTTGPFLEVRTAENLGPGADLRAAGEVQLLVKVQCTDWIDINRLQVLVNGRQRPDLNYTRKTHPDMFRSGVVKFEEKIRVTLTEDAHLIVVAHNDETNLVTGYGASDQAKVRPCAFNNPIFVDVDGGGFKANGDMLDHPLGAANYSREQARKLMEQRETPASP